MTLSVNDLKSIKELNGIHTSWKDYTLMLLNSTADPLRTIWREKIVTSVTHWEFNKGSISEGNIAGMEVLTVLPSELTESIVDDHFEAEAWQKLGRLNGSKRMNVHIGHYPQESISNEANLCIKFLVKNWNNVVYDGKTGKEIILNKNDNDDNSNLLFKIFDLAQKSGGKCVLPDEVCTYILEKPVNDAHYGVWIDVADDVFINDIPSEKYKKYWKTSKIEGYPLAEFDKDKNSWVKRTSNDDGTVIYSELTEEEQKENFLNLCDIILKEDVAMSPCWKKICICILKNDVKMGYAGFSATLKERKAREDAMAAFSTKQEEKEKAKANAQILAKKIEKENMNSNKHS